MTCAQGAGGPQGAAPTRARTQGLYSVNARVWAAPSGPAAPCRSGALERP
jgi:hypothetical protein